VHKLQRETMKAAKVLRKTIKQLSPRERAAFYRIAQHFPGGKTLLRWYHDSSIDAYLLSFPKCGRTWLRVMLERALIVHFGLEKVESLESNVLLGNPGPQMPTIKIVHDDHPQFKTPAELTPNKKTYQGVKVILLVRDMRDALVSNYFQATKRRNSFTGDLSSFIRYDRGSTDTFIRFYNIWAENRHVPADFLPVRYENIHADVERELRRILEFVGLRVEEDTIRAAIDCGRFDNMRKLETNELLQATGRLKPKDKDDRESYKTRRGKVGGFVEYLNESDIAYLNEKMRTQLSSYYGYQDL